MRWTTGLDAVGAHGGEPSSEAHKYVRWRIGRRQLRRYRPSLQAEDTSAFHRRCDVSAVRAAMRQCRQVYLNQIRIGQVRWERRMSALVVIASRMLVGCSPPCAADVRVSSSRDARPAARIFCARSLALSSRRRDSFPGAMRVSATHRCVRRLAPRCAEPTVRRRAITRAHVRDSDARTLRPEIVRLECWMSLPLLTRAKGRRCHLRSDAAVTPACDAHRCARACDAGGAESLEGRMPDRAPGPGEQYRFHFDMGKCIGCKCCVVACNEQNGNPASINWRRVR